MVRFTQPSALNDPEDCLPHIQIEQFSDEDYEVAKAKAIEDGWDSANIDELTAFYLQPYPAGRMSEQFFPGLWPAKEPRLRPEPFETIAEFDQALVERAAALCLQEADRQLGILSLSRSAREHMWAHYAADHSGLRIGFNESHPFFDGNGFDVSYLDTRIKASLNNGWVRIGGVLLKTENILNGQLSELPMILFFRKMLEWQYEQEFRMIKPLRDADLVLGQESAFPTHLFSIPAAAVVDVTFGYKSTDDFRQTIISNIRSTGEYEHVTIWSRRRSRAGTIVDIIID